jgi:phage gp36-like protein
MGYVTQAQIETAIPGPRLRDALDDDGDGQADEGLLDAIIASVDGAVDAYLAGLYDVPFATPPAPVIEASLVFACERIYDRRPGAEDRNPWRSRADWWRERLERIGKGEIPLDAGSGRSFAPGASVTENVSVDGGMG